MLNYIVGKWQKRLKNCKMYQKKNYMISCSIFIDFRWIILTELNVYFVYINT